MNREKYNPNSWDYFWTEIVEKQYQKGVDYETPICKKNYHILSEKLKKVYQEFCEKAGKKYEGDYNRTPEKIFWDYNNNQGSADYHRQQEWTKKENEEKRRKFIADNDPPQLKWAFLDEKDKLFNSQQVPLTAAEKAALNDPALTYIGDWEEVLWYVQANRRANSELYPDEYLAWERDSKLKGQALEVLQKAGVPLDKLFQRVEKGRQIKKEQEKEQQKKDKATILANLNDWIIYGPNAISNWKIHQVLSLNGENFTKHRFYTEYSSKKGKDTNEGAIESYFDPATFQEIRTAIFQNLLKNLRENKNYFSEHKKGRGKEISDEKNYSPAEWTEIQKALREEVPVSKKSSKNSPNNNNSSLRDKLIIISVIGGLIILILGGLFLIKKRKKKNGFKK